MQSRASATPLTALTCTRIYPKTQQTITSQHNTVKNAHTNTDKCVHTLPDARTQWLRKQAGRGGGVGCEVPQPIMGSPALFLKPTHAGWDSFARKAS